MLKRLSLFIATALLSCAAFGQSAPGFTFGQTPTPGQWNSYFSGKMDFAMPLAAGNVLTSNGSGWFSAPPATHGTVTTLSVNSGNGLSGTVATPSTTPAITLGTTVTGIVKGNGTALSAAVAGTDYAPGTAGNATGIVKSTTGTGALTTAVASDFPILNQSTTGNAATATLATSATTATTATTAGNVTGIVAIANGGTNASTAPVALTNLGAASSGANSNITSLTGLTTPLSLSQGGTGATSKASAFNALSPMTTTGDLVFESGTGVASRLGVGSTGQVLTVVSGAPAWASSNAVLPGYINGFTLSNDGTSPNTVLDIAAGTAADSTNAAMITGSAFTKSTTSSWSAGSGVGGMGTGLTLAASTWYHVFAIIKGGAFDIYFDTSPTAANKPAGTTAFRYTGSFKTNSSSQIMQFQQVGQMFQWGTGAIADLNGGTSSSTTPVTLSIPTGFSVIPQLQLVIGGGGTSIAQVTSSLVAGGTQCLLTGNPSANVDLTCSSLLSNSSGQINYSVQSGDSLTINTIGYINPRVAPNF